MKIGILMNSSSNNPLKDGREKEIRKKEEQDSK
jgi:hypothetical protein